MKKWMTLLLLLGITQLLTAQDGKSEDFMRSMGKIYVVVAVIVVVFLGITFFLIYLDRKLTKLEHQIKDHD